MQNNGFVKIIGFLMFLLGGCAVFLSFVGVNISLFSALEKLGSGTAFTIKLVIMILGIVISVLANTNKKEEDDEKDMYMHRNDNY
jgi:cbb3-type cytochrome oxidase subunit 3